MRLEYLKRANIRLQDTPPSSAIMDRGVREPQMNKDIDSYIDELTHTVTVAGLNFDIWHVYHSAETRPKYVGTLKRYRMFFTTSLSAHFVALLTALYRLYETRRDTYNIPSLLKILKEDNTINAKDINSWEDRYQELKPLWIKVSILRNKAFGHRSVALSYTKVLKEASVTPNDLRDLVARTKVFLKDISHAWNRSSSSLGLSAKEDTIRLLENLKSL